MSRYQPENQNFLSPIAFKFTCDAIPNVEYYCQRITLPGISISEIEIVTPLSTIYSQGGNIQYQELELTAIVDEDMNNWKEIYNWIVGIGSPENFEQYEIQKRKGLTSQGILTVLNSSYNKNVEFHFYDMFPLSITGLEFDLTDNDVTYLAANISFRYNRYVIK